MPVSEHPAVSAYLARFDAASKTLPQNRRQALRAALIRQLNQAIPTEADDGAVQVALERLGPPEARVRVEQNHVPSGKRPTTPERRSVNHEERAVLLMTLGSMIPVVGWLLGVVLLWRSKIWTTGEKIIGTLLVPLGPFGGVYLGAAAMALSARTCYEMINADGTVVSDCPTGTPWNWIVAFIAIAVALVVPFIVGSALMRRARTRAGVPKRRQFLPQGTSQATL